MILSIWIQIWYRYQIFGFRYGLSIPGFDPSEWTGYRKICISFSFHGRRTGSRLHLHPKNLKQNLNSMKHPALYIVSKDVLWHKYDVVSPTKTVGKCQFLFNKKGWSNNPTAHKLGRCRIQPNTNAAWRGQATKKSFLAQLTKTQKHFLLSRQASSRWTSYCHSVTTT